MNHYFSELVQGRILYGFLIPIYFRVCLPNYLLLFGQMSQPLIGEGEGAKRVNINPHSEQLNLYYVIKRVLNSQTVTVDFCPTHGNSSVPSSSRPLERSSRPEH